MGFLENLKSMSQQLNAKKSQLMTREFAHGAMAICALIAAADGSIDACEKEKTLELITTNEALSIFDPAELTRYSTATCPAWRPTTTSASSRPSR